jgi:hypothetical protein
MLSKVYILYAWRARLKATRGITLAFDPVYGGLEEVPRNEPGAVGFLSSSFIRVYTLLEEN